LTSYLRQSQKTQPLHNRLFLLWASAKLHDLLPETEKRAILNELWRKQEADGGWTMASLGQWKKRAGAPAATGSNSYATALAAFTTEQAGVRQTQPGLSKALAWLRIHQNRQGGYWAAESMNHPHEPGTLPEKFMSDAATGYAVAALLATGDLSQPTASSSKPRN